jgi:hypothetical protein
MYGFYPSNSYSVLYDEQGPYSATNTTERNSLAYRHCNSVCLFTDFRPKAGVDFGSLCTSETESMMSKMTDEGLVIMFTALGYHSNLFHVLLISLVRCPTSLREAIYVNSGQILNSLNHNGSFIVAYRPAAKQWFCKQRPLLGNRFITHKNWLTGKLCSLRGPCNTCVTQK